MNGLALPAAGGDDSCPVNGRGILGLSLCAGAGGLDLGLHLALPDYRTICYVERESFAAATLVARMEDAALDQAPVWDDVKSFDGKPWRGLVDILHGGYPCQPFSVAGRKLGDKDPRHLWPDIAKIVRAVKPPICFFENVGGHLRLGFKQVHDDLSKMDYRVKAGLFTAEEVGAPHKRERLFILAYREGVFGKWGITKRDLGWQSEGAFGGKCGDVGNTNNTRLEGRQCESKCKNELPSWPPGPTEHKKWRHIPADLKPAICRMADGMAHRVDRLRTCGNGVVPLAAAYAFCTLATQAITENGTE